jgi:hypothetical protein
MAWLVVEVDAGGDQEHEDCRGDPVDDETERWPPAGVGDMVVAVLPEVFESAEHQQPRRSGDGRRGTTTKSPATAASAATMLGRPSATAKPM